MAVGYWWVASALFCFVVACLVVYVYPKGAEVDPLDFFADGSREPFRPETMPPDAARLVGLPPLGTVRRRLEESVPRPP